ncbi:hydrogenase maturation protease [Streptomyces sp. NBC_01003]|uniref:hydrogenase maturation protease n=1 Tax=Streptomyces sp. NBC_01003 TaxID=2903714 RepID=UPI0038685183|nr:hydrogenase maturation protease [Streptomyces sp. NBC_01003]
MNSRDRIAVIGVGNDFRRDDGIGWAVVSQLRERVGHRLPANGLELTVNDGDPGRLIGLWEGAHLAIVVDAAHAHPAQPGRVHRIELERQELRQSGQTSSHGLGLGEAVELSRTLGRLPTRLVVFAVEGQDHTLGTGLTEPVAEVVEPLVQRIEEEIAGFRAAAQAPAPAPRLE